MAGQLVPLVMFPRFSAISGADTFYTVGMDVSQYSSALLNVWRSVICGGSPSYTMTFEESTDQVTWSTCTSTPTPAANEPTVDTETLYTVTLNKRWFRMKVVLTGSSVVQTLWAAGFLEERLT